MNSYRANHFNRRRRQSFGFSGLVVGIIILVAAGGIATTVAYANSAETKTCTVESKDRSIKISDGNSSTSYRVYTKDCGIYSVEDVWYKGIFNSADTYSSIKEGETYEFETIGFRNGFLSMFPNIVKATQVNE